MSDKLYSVFKRKDDLSANDLLFNQKGYIKTKTPFKNLSLLILHFPERTYHLVPLGLNILEYHQGKEFTDFLRANGVSCAEYDIKEAIDESKGHYRKKDGGSMVIKMHWIETGYDYKVIDHEKQQPDLAFRVGKGGKIKIDSESPSLTIEFVHQGPMNDPVIVNAFKEVKKSKRNDKVTGCLTVILILILMFILGQVWTWIFGEPDDPFLDLFIPPLRII